MNSVALNNLWSYLQGLALTNSNKQWLADHLYEDVKAKEDSKLQITADDLILSPEILEPVKDITPLPQDFDFDKARLDYLMKKYA